MNKSFYNFEKIEVRGLFYFNFFNRNVQSKHVCQLAYNEFIDARLKGNVVPFDVERDAIQLIDEYAESKAKEAFDAARQLDKLVVKSETDKGIEAFEAYTFKDYETYKNRKHE